ncbi:albusnodin/ikarugamycin family macrolactam cyclase [Streptomyces yaizuensis]|uniref:Albusnodin/ikarugamycin family macrolactam cyclase n=1 Tax=Streptomyces yaizuensis TaxID=2989713 RepID=A0ABQ5PA40_9ACTN|nr:albusnodin/ikarugamycin family macrolactam cyclase [Streptomyces sp. YSPA8]
MRTAGTARLGLVVVGRCGASAAGLERALADVEAGRWRALTRWAGSYLTVAARYGTTAVIGDLAGQHPVHWKPLDGGGLWWATAALPLAQLHGAAVDRISLAARLALGPFGILAERSLFTGVRRVPPGHLLLLRPDDAAVVRFESEPRPVSMPEGAPQVAAALTEAVTVRLDGRPGVADLAGLDSTTLVCLAAAQGVPVDAVTHADPRMRDDDLAYARRTAAVVPGVRHHTFTGSEEAVLYGGLEDPGSAPVTDEPTLYAATARIKHAQLDLVSRAGAVYLTGEGGDVVLAASAGYLPDLYREGRRREAWQHTLAHARVRRVSPLTLWRRVRFLARGGVAGGWRQAASALRAAPNPAATVTPEAVARQVLSPCARWLCPGVRLHLADEVDTAADAFGEDPGMADWSDRQDLMRIGSSLAGWRAITREHGMTLATPYLDNEVVRACLAVEASERGAADRYKPLLAAAFPDGPVPGFVLERTTKGGLDGVAHAGLVRHAGLLAELLGPGSHLAGLGLLPSAGVGGEVAAAASGRPGGAGAIHYAVAAELWLRQAADAPAHWMLSEEGDGRAAA